MSLKILIIHGGLKIKLTLKKTIAVFMSVVILSGMNLVSFAAADSRTVLNYSSGTESYGNMTNIKEYLSDANSDGLITAADSRLILRFASGLE